MKTKYFILLVLAALFILNGCEDILNENDAFSTVQRLEGYWQCDEDENFTKSTMIKYQVYITPSSTDSSAIFISRFHQLGENIEALGTVSGSTITLPQQTLMGGYTVYGSGSISSDVKKITWKYYIDDGSGQEEEVNAVYTFLY
jgi:hypothetical protein